MLEKILGSKKKNAFYEISGLMDATSDEKNKWSRHLVFPHNEEMSHRKSHYPLLIQCCRTMFRPALDDKLVWRTYMKEGGISFLEKGHVFLRHFSPFGAKCLNSVGWLKPLLQKSKKKVHRPELKRSQSRDCTHRGKTGEVCVCVCEIRGIRNIVRI